MLHSPYESESKPQGQMEDRQDMQILTRWAVVGPGQNGLHNLHDEYTLSAHK